MSSAFPQLAEFHTIWVSHVFPLSATEGDAKKKRVFTKVRTHELPSTGTLELPVEPPGCSGLGDKIRLFPTETGKR